jgi:hypothetical protein
MVGRLIPTPVEAHNQHKPYVYLCDCPVGVRYWREDSGGDRRRIEERMGECERPATHVWRVRMRQDGGEHLIARCSLPGHADTIKLFLRNPGRSYDLAEAILPIES